MKVAIVTMFTGLATTYSLVNVVAEQLAMLLKAGIDVKLIVSETCRASEKFGVFSDERIIWEKIPCMLNGSQVTLYDYALPTQSLHSTFDEEADFYAGIFTEKLADVDVCILQDILYQGWHYLYNIAIRRAQKSLRNVRFIAFTHSFPVSRPLAVPEEMNGRYTPMPNTVFVYPTQAGIPALAKQYAVPEGLCRVVYNSIPLAGSLSTAVQKLHDEVDLISPDILVVYPGRLTTGKKFDKVAALAGSLQTVAEKTVKVVFCDFPCADTPAEPYKAAIKAVGEQYGLSPGNLIFTSECGYPDGFPRQGVLDLFVLSTLFICPSFSEAFPLTALEAASRGNFLVLNQDVPALEEIGKALNAYFMQWDARNFGYNTTQTYAPSEKAYYQKHAMDIVRLMREDRAILAKTTVRSRFSAEWIWKNQLEPLLFHWRAG